MPAVDWIMQCIAYKSSEVGEGLGEGGREGVWCQCESGIAMVGRFFLLTENGWKPRNEVGGRTLVSLPPDKTLSWILIVVYCLLATVGGGAREHEECGCGQCPHPERHHQQLSVRLCLQQSHQVKGRG